MRLLGCAQFAIAAGSYGFVVRNGACEVMSDNSITTNEPITSAAAARWSGVATGGVTLGVMAGHAIDTQTAAGSLASAVLDLT